MGNSRLAELHADLFSHYACLVEFYGCVAVDERGDTRDDVGGT